MELFGTFTVRSGLAEMLKGGVIMDVTTPEQAKIAEDGGAVSVMALERVPADIRAEGGVARMTDPAIIEKIMDAVSIPVMAKVRIGHFVEAQILEAIGVDYIDESEVLTPADDKYHINKWNFKVPFVCGAINLGEALRRIGEGAAMIRTKGKPVPQRRRGRQTHANHKRRDRKAGVTSPGRADDGGKKPRCPLRTGQMGGQGEEAPCGQFSAGGIATPADAAMMMQLGADGVFVGSGIFKSENPAKRAQAIVQAVTHYNDPDILAKVSKSLGGAMPGLEISSIAEGNLLQFRGN